MFKEVILDYQELPPSPQSLIFVGETSKMDQGPANLCRKPIQAKVELCQTYIRPFCFNLSSYLSSFIMRWTLTASGIYANNIGG